MQRNERKRETKGEWRWRVKQTVGNVVRESLFPRSFGKNGQVPFITLAIHTTQMATYSQRYPGAETLREIQLSRLVALAAGGDGHRCARRAVVATHVPREQHFFSFSNLQLLFHRIRGCLFVSNTKFTYSCRHVCAQPVLYFLFSKKYDLSFSIPA